MTFKEAMKAVKAGAVVTRADWPPGVQVRLQPRTTDVIATNTGPLGGWVEWTPKPADKQADWEEVD